MWFPCDCSNCSEEETTLCIYPSPEESWLANNCMAHLVSTSLQGRFYPFQNDHQHQFFTETTPHKKGLKKSSTVGVIPHHPSSGLLQIEPAKETSPNPDKKVPSKSKATFDSLDEYSPENDSYEDGKELKGVLMTPWLRNGEPRPGDKEANSKTKSKYSDTILKPDSSLPPVIRRRNQNRRKQLAASMVDNNVPPAANSWDKQAALNSHKHTRSQSVSDEQWNHMLAIQGPPQPQGYQGSAAASEVGGISLPRRGYNTVGGNTRALGRGMVSSASVCDLNTLAQQQQQHQHQQQQHQQHPGYPSGMHSANSFQQLSLMSYDPNMMWMQPQPCSMCQPSQMFPQSAGSGGMKRTASNLSMNLSSVGSDVTGYPYPNPHMHHPMPMGYPGYYPGCHQPMMPPGFSQGSAMSIPDSMRSYNRMPPSPVPSARSSSHRSHKSSSKSRSFGATDIRGRRSRNHSRRRSEESDESDSTSISDEENLPILSSKPNKPGGLAWQCDHCTFINPGHVQSCGMCSKVPGKGNTRNNKRGSERRKGDKRQDKKTDSIDNIHDVSDYDNDQRKETKRENRIKPSGSVKSSSGKSRKKSHRRDSSPSQSSSPLGSGAEEDGVQLEKQLRDLRLSSRSRIGEYDGLSVTSRTREKDRNKGSLKKEGGGSRYRNRRRYHSDRSVTPARSSPSRRSRKASIDSDDKSVEMNNSGSDISDRVVPHDNKSSHEGTLIGTTASESNTLKLVNSREQAGSLKHWKNTSLTSIHSSYESESHHSKSPELEDPFDSSISDPLEDEKPLEPKLNILLTLKHQESNLVEVNSKEGQYELVVMENKNVGNYQDVEEPKIVEDKLYDHPDNNIYVPPSNNKGDTEEPSFANTLDGIETLGTNEVADFDLGSQALEDHIDGPEQVTLDLNALIPILNYVERKTPDIEEKIIKLDYNLYEAPTNEKQIRNEDLPQLPKDSNSNAIQNINTTEDMIKQENTVSPTSQDPSYEIIDSPDIVVPNKYKINSNTNTTIRAENNTREKCSNETTDEIMPEIETAHNSSPKNNNTVTDKDKNREPKESYIEKEEYNEEVLDSSSSENLNEVPSPRRDRQLTPLSLSSSDAQFYSPPNSPDLSLADNRGKRSLNESQVFDEEAQSNEEEEVQSPASVTLTQTPVEGAAEVYDTLSFEDAFSQTDDDASRTNVPSSDQKKEKILPSKLLKEKIRLDHAILAAGKEEEDIDEKYLTVEQLIKRRKQNTMKEQGLHLVQMLREAEELGYNPEEVSVALTLSEQNKSPVEWLQENWRHMVDTVKTLASNYGLERKVNDIGQISVTEAKKALRAHKGDIWAAVTECVEERQRKYNEIDGTGNFKRETIIKTLTDHEGNVDEALVELTRTNQVSSFFSKLWGGFKENKSNTTPQPEKTVEEPVPTKPEPTVTQSKPEKIVIPKSKATLTPKPETTTTPKPVPVAKKSVSKTSSKENPPKKKASKAELDLSEPTTYDNVGVTAPSSQISEETENEIYANFVTPLLEKLGDSMSKKEDGAPIISEELKKKIVKAILEGDPEATDENVVFDSDEETTIEELLAVAENPTFYDYFTAVDLEDFEDYSEAQNEPIRVTKDYETASSSYDSPGSLSNTEDKDVEEEYIEYEEEGEEEERVEVGEEEDYEDNFPVEVQSSEFEYFEDFRSVESIATEEGVEEQNEDEDEDEDQDEDEDEDEDQDEDEDEEEDESNASEITGESEDIQFIREEDVVVHPLKAYGHYADLTVTEYAEDDNPPPQVEASPIPRLTELPPKHSKNKQNNEQKKANDVYSNVEHNTKSKTREPINKQPPIKESSVTKSAVTKSSARDSSLKESSTKESSIKESSIHESSIKEPIVKQSQINVPSNKKLSTTKSSVKDSSNKESYIKESSIKQSSMKESSNQATQVYEKAIEPVEINLPSNSRSETLSKRKAVKNKDEAALNKSVKKVKEKSYSNKKSTKAKKETTKEEIKVVQKKELEIKEAITTEIQEQENPEEELTPNYQDDDTELGIVEEDTDKTEENTEEELVSVTTGILSLSLTQTPNQQTTNIGVKTETTKTNPITSHNSEEEEDQRYSPSRDQKSETPQTDADVETHVSEDVSDEERNSPVETVEREAIASPEEPVTVKKATFIVGKAIAKAMARESSIKKDRNDSENSSLIESPIPMLTPEMEESPDGMRSVTSESEEELQRLDTISEEVSGDMSERTKSGYISRSSDKSSKIASKSNAAPTTSTPVAQQSTEPVQKASPIPPAVASYSGPIFIPSSPSSVDTKSSSNIYINSRHNYYNDPSNASKVEKKKLVSSADYESISQSLSTQRYTGKDASVNKQTISASKISPSTKDGIITKEESKPSSTSDNKKKSPVPSLKSKTNKESATTVQNKNKPLSQNTSEQSKDSDRSSSSSSSHDSTLKKSTKKTETQKQSDPITKPFELTKDTATSVKNKKSTTSNVKPKKEEGQSSKKKPKALKKSPTRGETPPVDDSAGNSSEEEKTAHGITKVEILKNRKGNEADYQEVQDLKHQIQLMRKEIESHIDSEEDASDREDTLTRDKGSPAGPVIVIEEPDEEDGRTGKDDDEEEDEERTQGITDEDIHQYETLKFDRTVRRLLAEGQATTYEKAELAAHLLTLSFDETDSIQAAEGCSSIYTALQFLQQECELCAEKYPMGKMVSMLHCIHRCCYDCANNYFSFQIKTKNIRELRCPFCHEPDLEASEEVTAEYLNNLDILLKNILDQETHELFQRKLRDWTLMKDPNFKWCNKCSSGFIANPRARKLICPDCKDVTCAHCRKQWEPQHVGISCQAFSKWKEENDPETQAEGVTKHLAENGITCPRCRFTYSLAKGGCMHFTCTECKYEFCSGCSQSFKQGVKCTVGPYCERLGLHAHHPRNCLFYLRDKEPGQLQQLLTDHNIKFDVDSPPADENTKRVCRVLEQKETADGLKDDICGRATTAGNAGLCRLHYIEYLVEKINSQGLDPVSIFDEADLRVCLRRNGKTVPVRRWESEKLYRDKLIKLIKEQLPLS